MKVTKFNISKKIATYNKELSGIGLAASIRKWHEAYYLIKRGYTLYRMRGQCGLCLELPEALGCREGQCSLSGKRFCINIKEVYCPTSKNIKDVHGKWKYLRYEVGKATPVEPVAAYGLTKDQKLEVAKLASADLETTK